MEYPHLEFQASQKKIAEVVRCFETSGAALLRQAVPPPPLRVIRRYAGLYTNELRSRIAAGQVREDFSDNARLFFGAGVSPIINCFAANVYFMAALLRTLVASPLWPYIEAVLGTNRIAVPLNHLLLRRVLDRIAPQDSRRGGFANLGSGHQDGEQVHSEFPLTTWVALEPVILAENTALGVWPTRHDGYYSRERVVELLTAHVDALWRPSYQVGDVMMFGATTLHFTPKYNTGRERFSVEIRYCDAGKLPMFYRQRLPCLIVANRSASVAEIGSGYDISMLNPNNVPEFSRCVLDPNWQPPPLPPKYSSVGDGLPVTHEIDQRFVGQAY